MGSSPKIHALVLAGGFSTRLAELTKDTPKALLKIADAPIVQQIVDQILQSTLIGQIALLSNEKYFSAFQNWVNTIAADGKVMVLNNGATNPENRLGAIGDIIFSLEKLGWDDHLLVVASDTMSSLNLNDFLQKFLNHPTAVNAIFDTGDDKLIKGRLGNVQTDSEGKIINFLEKPEQPVSTLTSIPYYIFSKSVLPLIKEYARVNADIPGAMDAPGQLIAWLKDKIDVYAYTVGKHGYYFDVGTRESLEELQRNPQLVGR